MSAAHTKPKSLYVASPSPIPTREEAQRALELLMRNGKSQSAAIRDALMDASKLRLYEQAAKDAERLANDPDDRAEIAAIQALFAQLHAQG